MTIIISDLHGEITLLEQVLARFPERQYLFLGDLIDRGSDSPAVVQRVIDLVLDNRAILCFGNHEEMWIRGVKYQEQAYFKCWVQNGGLETIDQYGPHGSLMAQHIDQIEELGYQWYTLETLHGLMLCAHGSRPAPGVLYAADHPYYCRILNTDSYDHLWLGNGAKPHPLPEGYAYSAHGHVPRKQAVLKDGCFLLDTGPVKSGKLTVLDSTTLEFHTFSRDG